MKKLSTKQQNENLRNKAIDTGQKFFKNSDGATQSVFQIDLDGFSFGSEATVYFCGDPSVGLSSYYYTVQLPDISDLTTEDRDALRKKLEDLYTELDAEFKCKVFFIGERF